MFFPEMLELCIGIALGAEIAIVFVALVGIVRGIWLR